MYGQVRASTPLPALRGKKQPLARSRAEFRRSISHFPGRKIALCLPVGHPGVRFASPPRGVVSRSPPRNNPSDSVPPGEGTPSRARAENFPSPLCPTDIIAVSKCGFVVVIFTGGRRPGRDNQWGMDQALDTTRGLGDALALRRRFTDGTGGRDSSQPTSGTMEKSWQQNGPAANWSPDLCVFRS